MRLLSSTDPGFPAPEIWEAFVAGHPEGYLLQSHLWGQLKSEFGWRASQVALLEGDQIVGGALSLLRSSPIGSVAYVPRGPVLAWDDPEAWKVVLAGIRDRAQASGAIFLRIEPNLLDDFRVGERLTEYGFRLYSKTLQPRSTIIVDLTAEEEVMLSRMKPKTRYNIRLAARKGVAVHEGSESDLPAFYQLMQETSRRDSFLIHEGGYYRRAWEFVRSSRHGATLFGYL